MFLYWDLKFPLSWWFYLSSFISSGFPTPRLTVPLYLLVYLVLISLFICWNHWCLICLVDFVLSLRSTIKCFGLVSYVSFLLISLIRSIYSWPSDFFLILPTLLYTLVLNSFQKYYIFSNYLQKLLRFCYCPPVYFLSSWIFFPFYLLLFDFCGAQTSGPLFPLVVGLL